MQKQPLLFALLCLLFLGAGTADNALGQGTAKTEETVIAALKAADGQRIADVLNDLVDLDLPQYRGTYSKAQAGKLITDFLGGKKFTDFKLLRKGQVAEKEQYTLAEIKSEGQTYRVYFVVKDKDGKGLVPVFRITR